MQAIIDTFNERVGEIELYYDALKSLYDNKSYRIMTRNIIMMIF